MKYKRLCLYGGPSVGKSTLAAKLFVHLKESEKYKKVELVQEWIKTWAWEKYQVSKFDHVYVLAKQLRREERLLKQGVITVSDSPIALSLAYGLPYIQAASRSIVQEFEYDYPGFHVVLQRKKSYNPEGRWQTEEEAKELDRKIARIANDVSGGRVLFLDPGYIDPVKVVIERWEECGN